MAVLPQEDTSFLGAFAESQRLHFSYSNLYQRTEKIQSSHICVYRKAYSYGNHMCALCPFRFTQPAAPPRT